MGDIYCQLTNSIFIDNMTIDYFNLRSLYNIEKYNNHCYVSFNYKMFKKLKSNKEDFEEYCKSLAYLSNKYLLYFYVATGGDNDYYGSTADPVLNDIKYTTILNKLNITSVTYSKLAQTGTTWLCEIFEGLLYQQTLSRS